MAPNKFEENIKNKLEKRTIKPPDDAWIKLSGKLDGIEEKSNNKIVWWIGIAASLVGVFLATTLVFKNVEDETVLPTLVETPIKDTIKLQEDTSVEEVLADNEELIKKEANQLLKKVNTNKRKQNKIREVVAKRKEYFASKNDLTTNNSKDPKAIENKTLINSNTIVKDNKQQIVDQTTELEKEKNLVTDSEIESLLESAQKDIALNQIKKQKTRTINANSLLEDVEADLDLSFRDKIFQTIESGYTTVRTAVAERNY